MSSAVQVVPDPGLPPTGAVPAFGWGKRALRRRERAENFPVALRLLPAALRADLRAVYAAARVIDEAGDAPEAPPAERRSRLAAIEADLGAVFAGRPARLAVIEALRPAIARRGLRHEDFAALVAANRADQSVSRYETYDDLRGYCRLSANPVGRIVLDLFGAREPATEALADRVCTALQVLEHCQDVVEDRRDRDWVYLPLADLRRAGVSEAALGAPATGDPPLAGVRAVVRLQVDRAVADLAAGTALVQRLHGWGRVAVAGYVAGGLATADALRRARFDVLRCTPRPRRRDVLRHAVRLLAGAAGRNSDASGAAA